MDGSVYLLNKKVKKWVREREMVKLSYGCSCSHVHKHRHTSIHTSTVTKVKMWCDLNSDRCVCQGCGCHFKSMDGSIILGRLSTSKGLNSYCALHCKSENTKLSKRHPRSPAKVLSNRKRIWILASIWSGKWIQWKLHTESHCAKGKSLTARLSVVRTDKCKKRCF